MWEVRVDGWHPARVNQLLGHWSKSHKLKKNDKSIIYGIVLRKLIPPATGKRKVEVIIGLGYRQRGGDTDAYFKSLGDALVYNKLLVDDRKEWVEWAPVKYERSKDIIYTVIKIEDI